MIILYFFFKIDVIEGMTIYEDTPSNGFGDEWETNGPTNDVFSTFDQN